MKKITFLLGTLIYSNTTFSQKISVENLGLKLPEFTNCTSIKDQSNSSTCWSFSSNSLLESELIKNGKGEMDLSEIFVSRYSYYRKIKTYLKNKGTIFLPPRGNFMM